MSAERPPTWLTSLVGDDVVLDLASVRAELRAEVPRLVGVVGRASAAMFLFESTSRLHVVGDELRSRADAVSGSDEVAEMLWLMASICSPEGTGGSADAFEAELRLKYVREADRG